MTGTERIKMSGFLAGAATLATFAAVVSAAEVQVTIENPQTAGQFFFTPVWLGAHDGNFDTYDGGALASGFPGITEIAETGDAMVLSDRFETEQPGGAQLTAASVVGDGDAPVYSPGESNTFSLDVGDETVNRYFSYASMVVPSNDLFFANGNPTAHELFDIAGNFQGPLTIEVFGADVNDNGSEVNDAMGGAAFSVLGGDSVDESLVVRDFFGQPGDAAYLNSFVGTGTVSGDTILSTFTENDLIARITVTPEPSTIGLLALGIAATGRRRRTA
jgi:hypothetical protein